MYQLCKADQHILMIAFNFVVTNGYNIKVYTFGVRVSGRTLGFLNDDKVHTCLMTKRN